MKPASFDDNTKCDYVLEFTPLEFETISQNSRTTASICIRIYSVGVWNENMNKLKAVRELKLEFTPLEFETKITAIRCEMVVKIRIYSVGVWNKSKKISHNSSNKELEFTPLEFETRPQQSRDV